MQWIIVFTLIFLMSCSKKNTIDESVSSIDNSNQAIVINPLISPYVESFKSTYSVDINFSVTFDTDNATGGSNSLGSTVGVCRSYTSGKREVLINKTWWDSQNNLNRRILVFHELGHCKFNRDHDYELDSNGDRICLQTNGSGDCTEYKYRTFDGNPGKPISMMYPIINPISTYYNSDQNYYEYELLNKKPQSWDTTSLNSWDNAYNNYVSSMAIEEQISVYAMTDSENVPLPIPFDNVLTEDEIKYSNEGCVQIINDL